METLLTFQLTALDQQEIGDMGREPVRFVLRYENENCLYKVNSYLIERSNMAV